MVVGCTVPSAVPTDRSTQAAAQTGPRGTLRIAWRIEPDSLESKLTTGAGSPDFFWVFNSFLTYRDFTGTPHPMLINEIPTPENGLWTINPDGTMRTTFRIRDSARWHDMTPLTAQDYVFGFEVHADPEVPVVNREIEGYIDSVEAADERTLVVAWKRPYVFANVLGLHDLVPLPRHLMEAKYRTNKGNFTQGEEWTASYVGTGPFRVERWSPGIGLTARAHAGWALGAPKLESLEIRFIAEASTLLANLLAGEVDVTTSPAVGVPEALIARDEWVARGEGTLKTWETRLHYLEFQYREVPNWQPAVADVRVRRAMTHAIDRPALAEALTHGLGTSAEYFVTRQDPIYAEVERTAARYPYDPNRARALLAEAGWRGSGSGPAVNANGQTLHAELSATGRLESAATIVSDYWKTAGINASLSVIAPARERDREFRASFRSTFVGERTISTDNFYWTSSQIPSAATRFAELNRGGFSDTEIDRLYDVAVSSFDSQAQREAALAIHRRMADTVGYLPLMYPVEIILARRTVTGPIGNYGPQTGVTWNIWDWQIDT